MNRRSEASPQATLRDGQSFIKVDTLEEPNAKRSATLVTGDRVIVTGDGQHHTFVPRAGRRDLNARMFRDGKGHLHVIPRDAGRLIAAGKLDRRLFDVTYLLENRYGDGQRDAVPLIVRHAAGKSRQKGTTLTALAKAGDAPYAT